MDKVEIERLFEECEYVRLAGKIWYHPAAPGVTVFYKNGYIISTDGSKSNLIEGQLEFTKEELNDLSTVCALLT